MEAAVQTLSFAGDLLVSGLASGELLFSDTPLSFMGGVDPLTGIVIDTHHPLRGQSVSGKILAIPSGRGSCAGSGVIFEMLLGDTAPAALVFHHKESILTLGVVIAQELFSRSIPVVRLSEVDYEALPQNRHWTVEDGTLRPMGCPISSAVAVAVTSTAANTVALSSVDEAILAGEKGQAAATAMRIVLRSAALEGAEDLIDIDMAHIDGNFYQGPASLKFAQKLVELGATVSVPSTMNSLKVDRKRWRQQGVPTSLGEPSDVLADAYAEMGVSETYTCAPYALQRKPAFGQQIVWAESNAVVYANSVIGARTMKYPDYLDILVAITGRAPNADTHLSLARRATVLIDLIDLEQLDDSFFPTLGYHIGKLVPNDIPVIRGLEDRAVSDDDMKALGAAFASTSAAPMFHILGVTPEAATLEDATFGLPESVMVLPVSVAEVAQTWSELNSATASEVDVVSFGNPHFSLSECERLADLLDGKHAAPGVRLFVTCGREVFSRARDAGFVKRVEQFGGSFINDTCWCLIGKPIIGDDVRSVMTNSGKYAHYGPAQIHRGLHFGSFDECVAAATTGTNERAKPAWFHSH